MLRFVSLCFGTVVRLLRARRSLLIENLALRQQQAAIKRRHPRSQLGRLDKLFWVVIRQFWSQWKKALIVVTPETVVRWHQAGFRLYCRLISKVKEADREKTDAEAGAAVDLPDGCREHNLGSTSHPWGTAHARLRHLGADDLPLDETSAEGLRAS